MVKNIAIASVLVAATLAQAATLFDNVPGSGLVDPVKTTADKTVVGGTYLVDKTVYGGTAATDLVYRSNNHWYFEITSIDVGYVTSATPTTVDLNVFAADKVYSVEQGDGTSLDVWGPGYKFDTTGASFSSFSASDPLGGTASTVSFDGLNIAYDDNNWSGLVVLLNAGSGKVSVPLAQGGNIAGTVFAAEKDLWAGDNSDLSDLTLNKTDAAYPLAVKIDGTATMVPEAGTMQLALMGLAALGGFAGLRRFKRN